MPADALRDSLPDLVVQLRRDGVVLDHFGGRAVPHLQLAPGSDGRPVETLWPEPVAESVRRLVRKAIALRATVDGGFHADGQAYEVRVSAQGPDRAICLIRRSEPADPDETAAASDWLPTPALGRRGFVKRLQESMALAALCETPIAVAVILLEGVADIAQLIDAQISEQVLAAATVRLMSSADRSSAEPTWYAGQIGEFALALVLETSDPQAIESCIARACARLREPVRIGDATFELTPYAGIATPGQGTQTERTLLEHARAAALEAQRLRSADACFSSQALRLRPLARLDSARELRDAIDRRDIRLHYVGRHDLATGRLVTWVGYLRWLHPVRGEVRPAEFLAMAEATGLATALSRAALQCVVDDFAAHGSRWAPDVRISFGALRHHILSEDFEADILRLAAERALPVDRLELRIAERTFVAGDPAVFNGLARLGAQLVVDEMGRGMGSLDALARAAIWGLQLDRAWVTALRDDAVALKVCRAGITVAAALGLTPIATGVDDTGQRDALLALGCRYGSGDLYRESMPGMASDRCVPRSA
jgi:EAL domain-containing protein (putative c-di-GMP-specific phosphodiesterase class I)